MTFSVKLPTDLERFDAEIRVHHKNRFVQMARLHGPVVSEPAQAPPGSRIELEIATGVPDDVDLAARDGADAGIVRTGAGTTAVADNDFLGFDDDELGRVVREGKLLKGPHEPFDRGGRTAAEARGRRRRPAGARLPGLRALSGHRQAARKETGRPAARPAAGGRRRRSDFFPIELVYDLPAPATGSTLCPGWKTALRKGTCDRKHEAREGELYPRTFCPSGFWGLSKVIERKVVAHNNWRRPDDPPGFKIAVLLEPTTERDALESPHEILFAASNNVDKVKPDGIESVRKTLERIAKQTTFAKTWEQWVDGVARRPTLLVLLSHTTGEQDAAALEIGDGETVLGVQLLREGDIRARLG